MPRRKIPLQLEREIRSLARDGHAPSQIWRFLQARYPDLAGALTLRTVQRRCKAYGPPDDSGEWTLAAATPEEAAVVLAVVRARLSALMLIPGPVADDPFAQFIVRWRVTNSLARWIYKVALAAPGLPPVMIDLIAQEYREWELQTARGVSRPYPHDLDVLLACRPWRSPEAAAFYEMLLEKGAAAPVPLPYPGNDRWWRMVFEPDRAEQEGMTPDQTPEGGNDGTTREG